MTDKVDPLLSHCCELARRELEKQWCEYRDENRRGRVNTEEIRGEFILIKMAEVSMILAGHSEDTESERYVSEPAKPKTHYDEIPEYRKEYLRRRRTGRPGNE